MANHHPPQLFLVDGYALIYRAFFAMITRPLRTSKGENTSAAWGVVNFLLRLREKYRPDYVAWINDAGTSFRTERYAEYKSTREKLDEELQADFERACEPLLQRLRAPIERAVRDAGADPAALDEILLVGGASRMPMLARLVARMFGRLPLRHLQPDEVVHGRLDAERRPFEQQLAGQGRPPERSVGQRVGGHRRIMADAAGDAVARVGG